ncbi:unnamed protein product [Schistocephalus solidus]|uniref:C2H2-type domain-containing protein n=1 Tax=Schistocephalus solidus TaxID=70667 RepID=A0A183SJG1_SCHSO|nr:unnamed protein product [Schistocephalus solidus]
MRTGAATYEANRIAAAEAKRAARKLQAPRINTANAEALPTCPRCQRTIRGRIGLVGHLRTQCNNNPTTSTSATRASDPMTYTPITNKKIHRCPAAKYHQHHPPSSTLFADHGDEHHLPDSHHLSSHL